MFGRKVVKPHVPAKIKAFGRARLEIALHAKTREDWEMLWKPPMQPFPFEWGPLWKQCIEYRVDDFAAEVGFLIDVLGLPVNAFNANYAMFTSPNQDFYFAVLAAAPGLPGTPADAFRIQFMVADIFSLVEKLRARGIQFDQEPAPVVEGSPQWVAAFRTPHGICMEIWGLVALNSDREKPSAPIYGQEDDVEETPAQMEELPLPVASRTEIWSVKTEPEESRLSNPAAIESAGISDDPEEDELANDEEAYPTSPIHRRKEPDPLRAKPAVSRIVLRNPDESDQPVRLLPRSAIEKQANQPSAERKISQAGSTFNPAPKKALRKKASSIFDEVSTEAEYLELDNPTEEAYHYKPIPLSRDE